jgi:hypothetical protein
MTLTVENSVPSKTVISFYDKIKIFSDKQKLKRFISSSGKMITDKNPRTSETKNTRDDKYVGEHEGH